jgi:Flp pilus assembly secretin CpaC
VVYAANVRVGNNIGSLDEMLRLAMPEASIAATPMNNLVLLTGTVSRPRTSRKRSAWSRPMSATEPRSSAAFAPPFRCR